MNLDVVIWRCYQWFLFVDDIDNDNADDDHDMYDVLVTFIMMMIFHDDDDDNVKRKGGVCMVYVGGFC